MTHGSLEQLKYGPENIKFSSVNIFCLSLKCKHLNLCEGTCSGHFIISLDKCEIAQVIK